MLQAQGERQDLGEQLPFTPVATDLVTVAPPLERLLAFTQRWRLPLTLLLGTLITAAAFFAYDTKTSTVADGEDPSPLDEAPDGGPAGGDGALSGAVGDMVDGLDEEAGEESPATTGPTGRQSMTEFTEPPPGRSSTTAASQETSPRTGSATSATQPPPTTGQPATQQPTTTGQQATTTAAPQPVSIGDRVSFGSGDGRGASGIDVALLRDSDRNGVGESTLATASTGSDGAYRFSVEPGCYVVRFTVPDGHTVASGQASQALCLGSGEENGRVDLVLATPYVRPPPACEVQTGNNRYAGVEIRDSDRKWAPSYAFYDEAGNHLLSTSSLGPPDDVGGRRSSDIEWTSEHNGFEESDVYSVAAENDQGFASERVTCQRRRV